MKLQIYLYVKNAVKLMYMYESWLYAVLVVQYIAEVSCKIHESGSELYTVYGLFHLSPKS